MKFKKVMLISFLILAILTIGAVSASQDIDSSDELAAEDMGKLSVDDSLEDENLAVSDEASLSQVVEESEEEVLGDAGMAEYTDVGLDHEEHNVKVTTDTKNENYNDPFLSAIAKKGDAGTVVVKIGEKTVLSKDVSKFPSKYVDTFTDKGKTLKKYRIVFTDFADYKNFYTNFKTGDILTISFFKDGEEVEWAQYYLTTNEKSKFFQLKELDYIGISCDDWYVVDYGTSKKIYFTLLHPGDDKPIANKEVTVKYDGKTYTKTSGSDGKFYITVKGDKSPGTYWITVQFKGDSKYYKTKERAGFNIDKAPVKIKAAKKTFKAKAKTKKYVVVLKSHGKAIKKAKLKLKIKNKKFTAKTNKKGKAVFRIKYTVKGKVKAKITYKGNKYYFPVDKKVKLTFK